MKRILIYANAHERDAFEFAKSEPGKAVYDRWIGSGILPGINSGNRVWMQGLVSEIETDGNEITFYDHEMTADQINERFDLVILSMANVFGAEYALTLGPLTGFFSGIRIPTYVIACGLQAKTEEEIPALADTIGDVSCRFLETIYATGGEFALRGAYTKRFFDLVKPDNTAVVTGCPSLFQLGRDFSVDTERKVPFGDFKALLTGDDVFADYPRLDLARENAVFIDQYVYAHQLFANEDLTAIARANPVEAMKRIRALIQKDNGSYMTELLLADKIRLFYSPNVWRNFIQKERFSFAYGNRIHGSIMAILSGVPTLIAAEDLRVREIAEHFAIPHETSRDREVTMPSLYEKYLDVDYSDFNKRYRIAFDVYEGFLRRCGVCEALHQKNAFFVPLTDAAYEQLAAMPLDRVRGKLRRTYSLYGALRGGKQFLKGKNN